VNVLSLFSGIGGLDLGLQRAGMTIAGQVEIDPWCRKILAKHWPEVPRHDDVRTCAGWWGDRPAPDLVAGGFPCQPVSLAGKGIAQADERWLWPAMAGVIRELRPRFALMENVPGLLGRGMGDVLGDLAALGYDAEWDCVPASALGANHRRDRVWIVAYSHGDPGDEGRPGEAVKGPRGWHADRGTISAGDVADADCAGLNPGRRLGRTWPAPQRGSWWAAEPAVGRVADGVPARVDRLRGLGNAVVPQVAEHIGRLILKADLPGPPP
jgi:DNA (cytosine-5)-methyltransferase 1